MQPLEEIEIRWPIRRHLGEAITIMALWRRAGCRLDALPRVCHGRSWRRAKQISRALRRWALECDLPTAVLGFREPPAVIALGWWLLEAGLEELTWDDFPLLEDQFERLRIALEQLTRTSVIIVPGPPKTPDSLYSSAIRTVQEFGVVRLIVWNRAMPGGLKLSFHPCPSGRLERAGLQEHPLFIS